jgi:hypothetical protein
MAEPSEKPSQSNLTHTIVNWLTGITTWTQAGIALMLGAGILLGTMVYQNPQHVFELLSAAFRPAPPKSMPFMSPLYTDVQNQTNVLFETFAPDMIGVTVWRIDLLTNEQRLTNFAALPEYEPGVRLAVKERWKWPVAAFGDDPGINHILAQLYIGRFLCSPPPIGWGTLSRFPIAEICLIGIPPDGIGLAGFIGGGWRHPIKPADKPRIEAAFRHASNAMVWRAKQ